MDSRNIHFNGWYNADIGYRWNATCPEFRTVSRAVRNIRYKRRGIPSAGIWNREPEWAGEGKYVPHLSSSRLHVEYEFSTVDDWLDSVEQKGPFALFSSFDTILLRISSLLVTFAYFSIDRLGITFKSISLLLRSLLSISFLWIDESFDVKTLKLRWTVLKFKKNFGSL